MEDGRNVVDYLAKVRTEAVVEDEIEVVIAIEPRFEGVETVDAASMGDHGLSTTGLIFRDDANVPTVSIIFQIRCEELLLEIVANKFFGVQSLVPLIEIFDRGIEGTRGIGQRHI